MATEMEMEKETLTDSDLAGVTDWVAAKARALALATAKPRALE